MINSYFALLSVTIVWMLSANILDACISLTKIVFSWLNFDLANHRAAPKTPSLEVHLKTESRL